MRTISEQTVGRADGTLGWSSRIMGLTGVLGGNLFFALLHNPVQTFSATLPGLYGVALVAKSLRHSPVMNQRKVKPCHCI